MDTIADGAGGTPSWQRRLRWRAREAWLAGWDGMVRDVRATASPTAPPLLVISPHLDDAVLSCGGALAAHPGSTVVTVQTAHVPALAGATTWDRSCGFRPGDDVMGRRQDEDRAALGLVGASPRWLGVVEGQYTAKPDVAGIRRALNELLATDRSPVVLFPLGIGHADHALVSDVVVELAAGDPDRSWIAYDDLPYRELFPGDVERRLAAIAERGVEIDSVELEVDSDRRRKLAAVRRYRSQCRPLWPALPMALFSEGYRRVGPGRTAELPISAHPGGR